MNGENSSDLHPASTGASAVIGGEVDPWGLGNLQEVLRTETVVPFSVLGIERAASITSVPFITAPAGSTWASPLRASAVSLIGRTQKAA
jgi:hypothetical protein